MHFDSPPVFRRTISESPFASPFSSPFSGVQSPHWSASTYNGMSTPPWGLNHQQLSPGNTPDYLLETSLISEASTRADTEQTSGSPHQAADSIFSPNHLLHEEVVNAFLSPPRANETFSSTRFENLGCDFSPRTKQILDEVLANHIIITGELDPYRRPSLPHSVSSSPMVIIHDSPQAVFRGRSRSPRRN